MVVYYWFRHLSFHVACVAFEDCVCQINYDLELLFFQDQAQQSDHYAEDGVEGGGREGRTGGVTFPPPCRTFLS
jgi:hypothetical protein